ncbi:MAG: glycosyltransferase family 2 protein [Anaerolineae bacterium]|jgi:glycosyltransferase involved in cell wall biosynthesis|nr:glycosyltransferase family 2 protein [Anaerolineae bacterium]
MWQGKSVSVVFPVYNEEDGISDAIRDFFATGYVDEIVAVDNNSRDRSAELIQSTSARLVKETQQGYGHALQCGLREATGDLIILAEPDGTFMGKDILKLLAYSDDFELVMGTRTTRELIWAEANMGIFLRAGNWIVAKMLEFLFNTPSLSDCGCTLRLVHRDTAEKLRPHLTVGSSHFLPEMVVLCRLMETRMVEVPVNYRGRLGTSKITGSFKTTLKVGTRMIGLILRYRVASWLGRTPRFDTPAHE